MPVLLQINTVCNSGSTGRIAEEIGILVMQNGWKSYIAYGRGKAISQSTTYKICEKHDLYLNAAIARVCDNDGFCRKAATSKLINYIQIIKPDIVQLHNLHGYYLNLELLFTFLADTNIPVVWTLHDCWAFTGHCTHFEYVGCKRWQTECNNCLEKRSYPASVLLDNSNSNFRIKKKIVTSLQKFIIITPSQWLANLVRLSFLKSYPIHVINNGIDLGSFYPRNTDDITRKYGLIGKKVVLGVAGNWDERKGLRYLIDLSSRLSNDCKVVVVGVTKKQKKELPSTIIAIQHTEGIDELTMLYSLADVYVNPTLEDNFPTTNLEALACGTPVITFKTGGSIEAIGESNRFGQIVCQRDMDSLEQAVNSILLRGKKFYKEACVSRAFELYSSKVSYLKYLNIYQNIK